MADILTPRIEELWIENELSVKLNDFSNNDSKSTKHYVVYDVETELEAVTFAWESAPAIIEDGRGGYIPKKTVSIAERCNETTWKVEVEYEHGTSSDFTSDGDDEYSSSGSGGGSSSLERDVCFQCNAENRHIVVPIAQRCVYNRPGLSALTDAQSNLIPIGWNGKQGDKREVAGVDFSDSGIHEMYDVVISYDKARSSAWRSRICDCVGKVNSTMFHGWNPGEVYFAGASYSTPRKGVKNVKVTFDFCIRKNEPNAMVHGFNIGSVYGWNYIWATYGDVVNGVYVNSVIDYIFVAQVYPLINFDVLGV